MLAWPTPQLPAVPGTPVPLRLFDTASGGLIDSTGVDGEAGLYVCGITPYDATHMGHAATYVSFDLLNRAWRDNGLDVTFVQNITDVDDPLFERAARDGIDWRDLGTREIALFGEDMTALGVIPPDVYLGAIETIPLVVEAVQKLEAAGAAYRVPVAGGGEDVYFDISADPDFGALSHYSRETMLELFGERGGDPDRDGKRDPLDPLLWRAAREGEPSWDGVSLGHGRPGWHIECVAIALDNLEHPFDVNGGGSDLIFPHHEMGVSHANVLSGAPYARGYAHVGMVGLDGEKMSKSKGNLVKVSKLRNEGVDPMVIRLTLLAHHYRADWMWTEEAFGQAKQRLALWQDAFAREGGPNADLTVATIRERLADDLDAPGALHAVDLWAEQALAADLDPATVELGAPGVISRAVNALLGVRF